jgi:hypothetical protein
MAPFIWWPPFMDTLRETGPAATEARKTDRDTKTAESCITAIGNKDERRRVAKACR